MLQVESEHLLLLDVALLMVKIGGKISMKFCCQMLESYQVYERHKAGNAL